VRKWNGFIGLARGCGAKILHLWGVAPKILVLCGLAAGRAVAGVPSARGSGDFGVRGRGVLWFSCGEFVVRCGRLNGKGRRSFRRWHPSVLISSLIVPSWR
jgi:hypothetical protein